MGLSSGRSKEEINSILSAAKLDRKDLLPVAQEITFCPQFSGTEYRLLELPKELVETVRIGNRLVLRGEPDDVAVLCTEDATFEMKEAETSNSLMIFEELAFPETSHQKTSSSGGSSTSSDTSSSTGGFSNTLPQIPLSQSGDGEDDEEEVLSEGVMVRTIKDVAHSYFELKRINPNLSRIRNVLSSNNVYKGPVEEEYDMNGESGGITLEKLLEVIPASVEEIKEYLKTLKVIEDRGTGSMRLVDDDYLFRIFSLIGDLIDENSWRKDKIPKSVVLSTLMSLEPPFIIEKAFEWFFHPCSEENADIYSMKEDEICRLVGEALLRRGARINLIEFMEVWQNGVPEGLNVNLNQLDGLAVTNRNVTPPVIWHFPEYNLPDVVTDRFAVLFEAKSKWKLDEITPFLRNLPSSQSIGVLLTKFARVSTVNGLKFYSSKHSK